MLVLLSHAFFIILQVKISLNYSVSTSVNMALTALKFPRATFSSLAVQFFTSLTTFTPQTLDVNAIHPLSMENQAVSSMDMRKAYIQAIQDG